MTDSSKDDVNGPQRARAEICNTHAGTGPPAGLPAQWQLMRRGLEEAMM